MTKIEKLRQDNYGFGHGQENPHGLRLLFTITPPQATVAAQIADKFQGWPGVAHGGIVATILDEAMGHAVFGTTDSYCLLAELEVFYLAPVMTSQALLITGRVEKTDARKINAIAEIRRQDDHTLLAHSRGLYILVKGREDDLI